MTPDEKELLYRSLPLRAAHVAFRNGYAPEDLRRASDKELRGLRELGAGTLAKIRAAFPPPVCPACGRPEDR